MCMGMDVCISHTNISQSTNREAGGGYVYPSSFKYTVSPQGEVEVASARDLFTPGNLKRFDCAWQDKVPTAFFRGTATGMHIWYMCVRAEHRMVSYCVLTYCHPNTCPI